MLCALPERQSGGKGTVQNLPLPRVLDAVQQPGYSLLSHLRDGLGDAAQPWVEVAVHGGVVKANDPDFLRDAEPQPAQGVQRLEGIDVVAGKDAPPVRRAVRPRLQSLAQPGVVRIGGMEDLCPKAPLA